MTRPRLRPVFRQELSASAASLSAAFIEGFEAGHPLLRGKVSTHSADILVRSSERHLFSPYLALAFEEAESGTILTGRFAPAPGVWSGFVASYVLFGTLALFGTIFAFAQWSIGVSPWALYVVAISCVLLTTSYLAAFIGQNLGLDQMYEMKSFVDRCVEKASEKGRK